MSGQVEKVDRIVILKIAAEAEADPRSVAKQLRGEDVRGLSGERIRKVLKKKGLGSRTNGA